MEVFNHDALAEFMDKVSLILPNATNLIKSLPPF
jgi:hypothetical protein